jgi:hypothetical protein
LDIGDRNDPHGGQSRRVWFCHSLWLAAHANLTSLQISKACRGSPTPVSTHYDELADHQAVCHPPRAQDEPVFGAAFWLALKSIAAERKVPLHRLIAEIDESGQH